MFRISGNIEAKVTWVEERADKRRLNMTKTTFSQIITKQMMNKEKMVLHGFYKIGILHLEI